MVYFCPFFSFSVVFPTGVPSAIVTHCIRTFENNDLCKIWGANKVCYGERENSEYWTVVVGYYMGSKHSREMEASGHPVQDGAQTPKSITIQKEATRRVCVLPHVERNQQLFYDFAGFVLLYLTISTFLAKKRNKSKPNYDLLCFL